jgi:hypothetical protein
MSNSLGVDPEKTPLPTSIIVWCHHRHDTFLCCMCMNHYLATSIHATQYLTHTRFLQLYPARIYGTFQFHSNYTEQWPSRGAVDIQLSQNSLHFMEPEGSLPHLQQTVWHTPLKPSHPTSATFILHLHSDLPRGLIPSCFLKCQTHFWAPRSTHLILMTLPY